MEEGRGIVKRWSGYEGWWELVLAVGALEGAGGAGMGRDLRSFQRSGTSGCGAGLRVSVGRAAERGTVTWWRRRGCRLQGLTALRFKAVDSWVTASFSATRFPPRREHQHLLGLPSRHSSHRLAQGRNDRRRRVPVYRGLPGLGILRPIPRVHRPICASK